MATSLKESKKRSRSRKFIQIPFIGEKTTKIGPVDLEIICLKLKKETRKAWQSLAYSPLGAVVSTLSEY